MNPSLHYRQESAHVFRDATIMTGCGEGGRGDAGFPLTRNIVNLLRMSTIGVGIIGAGRIALANHIPGLQFCPGAQVVALCDSDRAVLEAASQQTGIKNLTTDFNDLITRDDVQAVVVATPNYLHAPIALAAAAAKKHILCEKPIAMNLEEAERMYRAVESAGVRHMTAFTYRFVPAMRYMAHLIKSGSIGRPYHFRANRFQDWAARGLGWRQIKKLCATGELGDMLSHRIDYGFFLIGLIKRIVARMRIFIPQRGGQPTDVDDWVAMLGDFENGATGVWESSKLTTGRGEGANSPDFCEVNGSDGTIVYQLSRPWEVQVGKKDTTGLQTVQVPEQFLKLPSSTRDPRAGDPLATFRYDQDAEFIDAIRSGRPCQPSFLDGVRVQAVMDAAVLSDREGKWVEIGADYA